MTPAGLMSAGLACLLLAPPAPDASGPAPDASGPAPDASGPAPDASGPAPDASGPAPAASGPASDASRDRDNGELTLRFLEFEAKQARRERLTGASFGLVLASSQIGLGVYGIVLDEDGGTGTQRAAIGQTIAGGVGVVGSIVGLVLRSPLEQMQRGATYARLRANPADTQALEDLRLDWTAAAKRAKRRRFTQAGLQLGAGAILIAVSSARLAASGSDTTSSEQVWAFTTLASAIGLTLAGIPTFILPSATERSLATYEAARAPAKPSVRVAPTLGGLAVSGRF